MNFSLDPELILFRDQVREFIEREIDADVVAGLMPQAESPAKRAFLRKLAARGWVGLDLPVRYGGGGRPAVYRLLLQEELDYAHLPTMMPELGTALTVLRFGSEDLKEEILPRITAADLVVALGLSEPDAGTDLANLSLRARRDGDGFVVDGSKMWTSAAHFADVIFLACRTTRTARPHEGISLLLVDVDTPGVEVRPISTMGGHPTNAVFFGEVRVPARRLIGDVDQGWRYLTQSLEDERTSFALGGLERDVDEVLAWIEDENAWQVSSLAALAVGLAVRLEASRTHLMRSLHALERGQRIGGPATMLKITLTEAQQALAEQVTELGGPRTLIAGGERTAVRDGRFERGWREHIVSTIGGGANEAMRDLVAHRDLGLPRAPRISIHGGGDRDER